MSFLMLSKWFCGCESPKNCFLQEHVWQQGRYKWDRCWAWGRAGLYTYFWSIRFWKTNRREVQMCVFCFFFSEASLPHSQTMDWPLTTSVFLIAHPRRINPSNSQSSAYVQIQENTSPGYLQTNKANWYSYCGGCPSLRGGSFSPSSECNDDHFTPTLYFAK